MRKTKSNTKVIQSVYIALFGTTRISADWNNFKTITEARKFFKATKFPNDVKYTIVKVTLRTTSFPVK